MTGLGHKAVAGREHELPVETVGAWLNRPLVNPGAADGEKRVSVAVSTGCLPYIVCMTTKYDDRAGSYNWG
jgi:hypothetical protein